MGLPSAFAALADFGAESADLETRIGALLRRTPHEVCMWRKDGTTCEDLPMEECRDLVFERSMQLLHIETLAMTVSEFISVIVPLASTMDEVDDAIRAVAAWIEMLTTGSVGDDVLHVMRTAQETGLLDLTHDDFADQEGRDAFDAAVRYHGEMAERAVCKMTFSGKPAMLILEDDGVLVTIQLEGCDWAVVCLIAHHGSDGDWNGDDGEPEPEPGPEPTRPELVPA
jgi:hypothetical protein